MAPIHKPSWVAVLFIFTLTFVTKATAIIPPVIHRSEYSDGGVEIPNTVPEVDPADTTTGYENTNSTEGITDNQPNTENNNGTYTEPPRTCETIRSRQNWRDMTNTERLSYINAVQCLQHLEPKFGIPHARSRFDEFQGLHIVVMDQVHLVGQFLPWHRLMISQYEKTMIDECGYDGAQPYWDWTYDTGNFTNSSVFDPVYGFGSVNPHQYGPVQDGPFADYKLVFGKGPAFNLTEHVIERHYNATQLKHITPSEDKRVFELPTFEEFRVQLEGWPITPETKLHDAGHYAVGGDMGNFWSSPGDPLFYLHHTNLDRLWWKWQKAAPEHLYQISGRSSTKTPFNKNVTLDFVLSVGEFTTPTPIRDIIETETALCYTYV